MDWVTSRRSPFTVLTGKVGGKVAVKMEAMPRFGKPGEGIAGWTITTLTITEQFRGDSAFTEIMIPEIMEQVKLQGWMTDDDLLDYHWEDDGLHVGTLKVMIPLETRNYLLAQRVVMRDEVDKIAAERNVEVAEPLTPEVEQVIEWAEATE